MTPQELNSQIQPEFHLESWKELQSLEGHQYVLDHCGGYQCQFNFSGNQTIEIPCNSFYERLSEDKF